jgi:peptidyl-prolyl cis-trans isomerase B (cyclophilin B)
VGTDKRARQKANRQQKFQQEARQYRRRSLTRRVVIGVIVAVVAVAAVVAIALLSGIGDDDETIVPIEPTTPPETTASGSGAAAAFTYGTGECPPDEVAEPTRTFADAPQQCIDPARDYTATMRTSEGDITIDLDTVNTPGTVNNFVTLARYGYYDDTKIFRTASSVAGEIIQGGGQTNADQPGYTIPDEGSGFVYEAGQIVMARTPQPNSAGGQWFLVTEPPPTPDAEGTYVVFGTITEGLDVARAIRELGGEDGAPSRDVTVETVEITEA